MIFPAPRKYPPPLLPPSPRLWCPPVRLYRSMNTLITANCIYGPCNRKKVPVNANRTGFFKHNSVQIHNCFFFVYIKKTNSPTRYLFNTKANAFARGKGKKNKPAICFPSVTVPALPYPRQSLASKTLILYPDDRGSTLLRNFRTRTYMRNRYVADGSNVHTQLL